MLSGISIDHGRTLAVDAAGNVIIGGSFNQSVALDSQQTPLLTSKGAADGFVAKFSPAGVLQWAKSFGGNGEDIVYGVTVDKGGNIAVAGSFEQTMSFTGGGSLASAGLSDGFIARFTPMGNYLWAVRIGAAEVDIGYAIAADDVGNLVEVGAACRRAGRHDDPIRAVEAPFANDDAHAGLDQLRLHVFRLLARKPQQSGVDRGEVDRDLWTHRPTTVGA